MFEKNVKFKIHTMNLPFENLLKNIIPYIEKHVGVSKPGKPEFQQPNDRVFSLLAIIF